MASGKATIYFDGRHHSDANTLTVFIDDVKTCTYEGGGTCSAEVSPGRHVITIRVYNDASEHAYWLGPFTYDIEAGMEYDFAVGKNDDGGSSSSSSYGSSSRSSSSSYGRSSSSSSGGSSSSSYRPSGGGSAGGSGSSGNSGGCCGCLILIVIAVLVMGALSVLRGPVQQIVGGDTKQPEVQTDVPSEETPEETEWNGFVFPDSDTQPLSQEAVEQLSDDELIYAINELYARHGYIFRIDEVRGYYEQFDWYTPEVPPDEFSFDEFNQTEQQNMNLLVRERDARKGSG